MRRSMLLAVALALASFGAFAAEPAQKVRGVPNEKSEVILELLKITGALDVGNQVMGKMLETMMDGEDERKRKIAEAFASKLDMHELTDQMVMLYADHFTTEEVQAIVAFFKSEVGQKLVAETPAMMEKSMKLGQMWAQVKLGELLEEMKKAEALPTKL